VENIFTEVRGSNKQEAGEKRVMGNVVTCAVVRLFWPGG
jgi:hypothetical protein